MAIPHGKCIDVHVYVGCRNCTTTPDHYQLATDDVRDEDILVEFDKVVERIRNSIAAAPRESMKCHRCGGELNPRPVIRFCQGCSREIDEARAKPLNDRIEFAVRCLKTIAGECDFAPRDAIARAIRRECDRLEGKA